MKQTASCGFVSAENFRVAALCAILVSNTTDRKLDCSTWHHDDNNRAIRKAQLGSAVFLGRPISSKLWTRIRPQLFAWNVETTGAVYEKQKFLQNYSPLRLILPDGIVRIDDSKPFANGSVSPGTIYFTGINSVYYVTRVAPASCFEAFPYRMNFNPSAA